ncbi:MAG: penicillin-binding protein 2 [Saprospiraceae bacterium]
MQDTFNNRKYFIRGFFILIVIALVGKAFQLQVMSSTYAELARSVVVSDITLYPSRGLIYDRNQKLIVVNEPMYDLMVIYDLLTEMDTSKFCKLLEIDSATFEKNLNKNWKDHRFDKKVPFAFLKKMSAIQYAQFQESMYEFPGFFVQMRNVRRYPENVGAHVLGYISEVNNRQLEKSKGEYQRGDYIGSKGIELYYEDLLRGTKGRKKVMKDNFGRIQGNWLGGNENIPPVSGMDLVTTLDVELQKYAEKLMGNKRGAVVAIEPKTGEILTMVSTPTYNPNLLSISNKRGEAFAKLSQDTLKPFFDRSLTAQYPPGSIFKSVMSLIGMQTGIWKKERGVSCNGGYNYGGKRPLGCHGHVYPSNVKKALQHSCNSYYCQLFREVVDQYGYTSADKGLDTLSSYLRRFGMGRPLGIDVPNEQTGLIPQASYYDKLYGKGSWRSPTIISLAIGQGEIQMTTLQMANLATAIANKGWFIRPHLIKEFRGEEDTTDLEEELKTKFNTGIRTEYFETVHDGMELAVAAGTARLAQVPSFTLCGKTGTSENRGTDHSVFFSFAPKENPQIAIAVFIENAGFGGTYAAPISSLISEYYLQDGQIDPSRAWIEKRMLDSNLLLAK